MNVNLNSFSVLVLFVSLFGCGGGQIKQLDANSQTMQVVGFKVLPPQRAGWNFSGSDSLVAFFRLLNQSAGQSDPQTLVISVETQGAPINDIATVDGLLRYTGRFSSTVTPERRQRLLEHKMTAYRSQGTDCVRFEASVEEQPRKTILEMRGAGFVCRHPFSPGYVVRGMYSERHVGGGNVQPIDADISEAEGVLKSVEFTPMR